MPYRVILAVGFLLLAVGCSERPDAEFEPLTPENTLKVALEAELIPVVTIEGDPSTGRTLDERRQDALVNSVSIAVFQGGVFDWADAYGPGADTSKLYQAASLSKTVASATLLTYAKERGVDFDQDLRPALRDIGGLDLDILNPIDVPITLRKLLSHTNGASVGGFPGYAAGEVIPTNLQVVTGDSLANTKPVVFSPIEDGERRYSGGGYQLAQLWAETVSGEEFAALAERLVFEPIGIERATFAINLIQEGYSVDEIAAGHGWDGQPMDGGWHRYPESAAAGLWITPEDYGRFVLALMQAYGGDASAGLDVDVAQAMMVPIAKEYGLGVGVETRDGILRIRHSGWNENFRAYFMGVPAEGDVIVTMVDSARGMQLSGDINRTANRIYGWPTSEPRREAMLALSDAKLASYAGDYVIEGNTDTAFTLSVDSPFLRFTTPSGYAYRYVPIGENLFIDPDDGEELVLEKRDDIWTVEDNGTVYVRRGASG
ncbi:MAG: serine hydrolase domain-containing protein [Pseudomonadota bacterium]